MRYSALLSSAFLAALVGGCQQPPDVRWTPLSVAFRNVPWDGGSASGRELISRHYRVYTTSGSPEVLNYLPGFMEAAHANYLEITGLPPREAKAPMPIYMMGTRQQWAALTRSIVGSQWNLYSSIEAGGYCHKGVCVFWDMGGISALSVASHEGLHQFLAHRMKDQLPMWLEEGLAASAEGYQIHAQTVRFTPERNPGRFGDLRKAIVNGWWVPLPKLLKMDGGDAVQSGPPERAVGYYGQLWALALFLRSDPKYAQGRARLLADAEAGRLHLALKTSRARLKGLRRRGRLYNQTVSAALFRHYVDDDLGAFERRYKAFAKRLAKLE